MPKRAFVYGAALLFGANLLNRILGFVYQYLIMTHIGGEAYGLYAMAFPIYMLALVLTTAGIPFAVAKLVSEEVTMGNYRQAKVIFRLALGILGISGVIVSIGLLAAIVLSSGRLFPDPRVAPVILICVPAVFIVSISSAYRGYFQGLLNMLPPALSQTIEQVVRVAVGFSISLYLLPRGIVWAAVGLAFGMVVGEAVGLIALGLQYRLYCHQQPGRWREQIRSKRYTLARIWQLAAPVTTGRLLSSVLPVIDAMLIPRRLQTAGYTARQATILFGQLGGTGFTLLSFPTVFTFALAVSLVPSVAEATAKKSFRMISVYSKEAIRVTILVGLPCSVILFYFAEPLTALFSSAHLAPILRVLAIGSIFFYLQHTTTAVLQGLGKVNLPLIHLIIASVIRLPLLYWLTGLPSLGLSGSAWAIITGFFIVAILNIAAIRRQTDMPVDLNLLGFQPISAALGMILFLRLLTPSLSDPIINYPEEMAAGCLIYLIILILNGGITKRDLRRIFGFIHL